MLAISELPENPVSLSFVGKEGGNHTVVAERLKGGRVRIRCDCGHFCREKWCRHVIDLICMRHRALGIEDPEQEFRFEEIVLGTQVEDLAHEVDLALSDYDRACAAFDAVRTHGTSSEALDLTKTSARDLSDCAGALADALARFKRKLAAHEG